MLIGLAFCGLSFGAVWVDCEAAAQEAPAELAQATVSSTGQEKAVPELLDRLGSASYQEREAAAEELLQIGAEALPTLLEVVSSDEPEIAWRASDLIEQIAIRGDEQLLATAAIRLRQIGQQLQRADLIRRSQELRQAWQRHRTEAALKQLRERGARVVQSDVSGNVVGLDGPMIAGGAIVIREAGGGMIIRQGGVVPADAAAADSNPVTAEPLDLAADWLREPRLNIPADWLRELEQFQATWEPAADEPAVTKEAAAGEAAADQLFEQRRQLVRLQLLNALREIREERLPRQQAAANAVGRRAEQADLGEEAEPRENPMLAQQRAVVRPIQQRQHQPRMVEARLWKDAPAVDFFVAQRVAANAVRAREPNGKRIVQLTFDQDWQGTAKELRLLQQVEHLTSVQLNEIEVTPDFLVELALVESLQGLSLDKATFDTEWLKAFCRVRPGLAVTASGPAYLGVNANINPAADESGCEITNVVIESAADQAGLKVGDRVVRINDQPVSDFLTLTLAVANKQVDEAVEVEVHRGGQRVVTRAVLGDRDLYGR